LGKKKKKNRSLSATTTDVVSATHFNIAKSAEVENFIKLTTNVVSKPDADQRLFWSFETNSECVKVFCVEGINQGCIARGNASPKL
jgi:hypothetical protein